jgi:hypothetical protein
MNEESMPALSLAVCVFKEGDLLERLLKESSGLYDDLVVVHDGPEFGVSMTAPLADAPPKEMALEFGAFTATTPAPAFYKTPSYPPRAGSLHELVTLYGGRYFEGPRCFQQEPHWPFAWSQAKHDWILRLDADELPSAEMKKWIRRFREALGTEKEISGYTCIWPLWNGKRAVTKRWPSGRIFLLNRQRVRFFGMVEQVPIADTAHQPLSLILHHQPKRKSYGVRNILFRKQAYNWRSVIARSLMGKPTDLPRWRWETHEWPSPWHQLRCQPLKHAIASLIWFPIYQLKDMVRASEVANLSACLNPGLHHFMLGIRVLTEKWRKKKR